MAQTEEKTYLVNVKSNLDKYAADAAKAAEEVDKLTVENIKLKASGEASKDEIEKSNSALRAAKKEYTDAKKAVDLQTQANNSNINSRKQLNAIVTLEQKRLGSLANTYTINEKGVRVLSQSYIEQVKRLKEAKDAVISYDKAQGDGRSSVGLYSEAIEKSAGQFAAIPGPIGQAGAAVSRYSKILLTNPIVLIITAIVAALALLVKAFKSTDSGGTEFAARFEQIKAIIDVVRQRLIAVTKAIGLVFKGEWKEAGEAFKEAFTGIGAQIGEATRAAYEYVQALDVLTNAEQNYVSQAAENRNKIAKLEFTAQDATKSTEIRRQALIEAMKIGLEEVEAQKKFAENRLNIEATYLAEKNGLRMEDVIGFTKMTDAEQANASGALKLLRDNNEEKLIEIEGYYANILDLDTKYFTEQKRNISRLSGFEETERKKKEAAMLKTKTDLETELNAYKKFIDDKLKADVKANETRQKEILTQAEWERNQKLTNQENLLAIQEFNNENIFAIERNRLRIQQEDEIATAKKTGADVNIINEKYRLAQRNIDEAEADAKLMLYADFAGNLASIFGQQTVIGKLAAIAATTISTYAAAQKSFEAYALIPGPMKWIAAGAAVVAGIATVKKIIAVKSGLPGDSGGGSVPTSISATPAAQRVFASQAQSSFFTQPQLSQTELNAASQGDLITASDIAEAIMKLPAPIVTVEDINARTESKRKIEVRATI